MVTDYKTSKVLAQYVLDAINPVSLLLRVFDEELKQRFPYRSVRGAPLVLQLRLAHADNSVDNNYVVLCAGSLFSVQPDLSLSLSFRDAMLRALNAFTFANTTADMTPEDDAFDELSDAGALAHHFSERKFN